MKNLHKKIGIFVFLAIIIGYPTVSFITMPKEKRVFSDNKGAYLEDPLPLTVNNFVSGRFSKQSTAWWNDHIFAKDELIQLKNKFEKLLGKQEQNGTFTISSNSSGKQLIEVFRSYDAENFDKTVAALKNFSEKYSDIPMNIMLCPTAQEIYRSEIPHSANIISEKNFIDTVYKKLPLITPIDVLTTLSLSRDEYIYYRTDHHWTSLGAFYAYTTAGNTGLYIPKKLSDFNIESVTSSFSGSLYRKTLDKSIKSDIIDIYTLSENSPEISLEIYTLPDIEPEVYDSMYFREYLDKVDKYSVFFSGNHGMMKITNKTLKNHGDDSKLLIFKDSYANSLIPFLTSHYSEITVIDMRHISVTAGINSYIGSPNNFDSVFFIFNTVNFANDDKLKMLSIQ